MVKPSTFDSKIPFNSSKNQKSTTIGDRSGNQRTLLQCWKKTKETVSIRSSTNGVELIQIDSEEECTALLAPVSSTIHRSSSTHFESATPFVQQRRSSFIVNSKGKPPPPTTMPRNPQTQPVHSIFRAHVLTSPPDSSHYVSSASASSNNTKPSVIAARFKREWNGGGFRPGARNERRCPFYKKVGDTPYVVDAFNYAFEDQTKGYFLSHFHSDHYTGLSGKFDRPIYCSEITANLAQLKTRVQNHLITRLPMETWTDLPDKSRVYLLDANHCPGAVIFVFQTPNGRLIVHTGDMRADESVLRSCQKLFGQWSQVDTVHLDTTYLDPTYAFPDQSDVIDELIRRVQSELRQRPNSLIAVGAYQIGKERVFRALAEAFKWKIYVQPQKREILACLGDESLNERLTMDPNKTQLHVVAMNVLTNETMMEYLRGFKGRYDSILGISATGWEYGKNGNGWRVTRRGNSTVIGAPYSEHSSYDELKRFVQLIKPRRVIPTVNVGNENSRKRMQDLIAQWQQEDGVQFFQQQRIGSFLTN